MNKCGDCKHYTGINDLVICCTEYHEIEEYPLGILVYEDTKSCDKFKEIGDD